MNAYFFKMNREEKENILDQHKKLYDGYVTKYNQESNQTPLYVQDLANDKNGITVNGRGDVKNYTNVNIHEQVLDTIGDGPDDLKNGTVDFGDVSDMTDVDRELMHDKYPSPNEDEIDYVSVGKEPQQIDVVIDLDDNDDRFEYDIDELEDFSTEGLYERYHETDPDNEEEDYLDGDMGNVFNDVDDDILPDLTAKLQESWDMFERFKKYN